MNALQSKIKSILLILLEFLRNPNAEEYYPFLINRIQRIYAVKKSIMEVCWNSWRILMPFRKFRLKKLKSFLYDQKSMNLKDPQEFQFDKKLASL